MVKSSIAQKIKGTILPYGPSAECRKCHYGMTYTEGKIAKKKGCEYCGSKNIKLYR
jgi:Zn finger protein HypA/HybF involved in hydrogenase expression